MDHATTAPFHPDAGHHPSKFHTFVQIAMVLAAITGVEIVLVYLPLAKWLIIGSLGVLSAVKFLLVIFYFMHLKWDKAFCTILFFIGLVLAGGTLWALLLLFGAEASKPPVDELSALITYAHNLA
ncbi:cytochrome C oxidase subunit IV family protein [Nibricoccus sp. IMCC34717]|uniref:cytochrome C oxidase subunit IV family protein n=1 Tax=Nibricoccus sp. IMCC34717 TaxID=3034021 RepID=UPI00384E2BE2